MVTYQDVQETLGRPLTQAEQAQAERWIKAARLIIRQRLGALDRLDQEVLDFVVTEAVARRIRQPDAVRQVSVSVDDTSMARTYAAATGQIEILPEWWAMLAKNDPEIFSIRPHYQPGYIEGSLW